MPGPATLLDGNKVTVKEVMLSFWRYAYVAFYLNLQVLCHDRGNNGRHRFPGVI